MHPGPVLRRRGKEEKRTTTAPGRPPTDTSSLVPQRQAPTAPTAPCEQAPSPMAAFSRSVPPHCLLLSSARAPPGPARSPLPAGTAPPKRIELRSLPTPCGARNASAGTHHLQEQHREKHQPHITSRSSTSASPASRHPQMFLHTSGCTSCVSSTYRHH